LKYGAGNAFIPDITAIRRYAPGDPVAETTHCLPCFPGHRGFADQSDPGPAPHPAISPDLIFLIFLPPLLYEAAWYTSWPAFWKMRWPIGFHGFGLVIVTSIIVAFVSEKLVPRFTLSIGLLLGGIISPPDAVAVSAVLKFFKIPRNVKTVLEGESLVNDAASLTVFRFALAAFISGTFVFHKAAGSFILVTVMGIVIGLIIGQIIYFIHKLFSTTTNIATALTLITLILCTSRRNIFIFPVYWPW
jgi:NhaP-type Na+/H+ or K+/H+ antiporter